MNDLPPHEQEAQKLLAHLDWAMIGAWKSRNHNTLKLVKAIIDNEKQFAPPPPPLSKESATAIQVSIFDNHAKTTGKKKSKVRFGTSVKVWVGEAEQINFVTQDPTWNYTGDLLDSKGLKEKAKALQKTTGYGKVAKPISDDYRLWLEQLAAQFPEHNFVPLMASGKFGRLFPEGEVLMLNFEKNGANSSVSEAHIWLGWGDRLECIPLNEFVRTRAASENAKPQILPGNTLLQSRTAQLPRWATPLFPGEQ